MQDARIIPAEQPIKAKDFNNGLVSFKLVFKHLQAQGPHEWTKEEAIIPLVKGQTKYVLGPDGDDVAKDFEMQIGKSKDLATQLRSQKTELQRVGLAYTKLAQASAKLTDPAAMKEALDSGTYKSAAVAAQKYADIQQAVVAHAVARQKA